MGDETVTVTPEFRVRERGFDVIVTLSPEDIQKAKESGKPSTIPIKIIKSGWGSAAYYPKSVLERDGPQVFSKGTHMYWNHATDMEDYFRPEGDLNNLAAVLTENAHWDENGAKGPGLYSKAKLFSDYSQQITEKGAHIGVSINAFLKGHEGEQDGRKGLITDHFVKASSIDFVTKAGAGGAPIVPVVESQRAQPTQGDNNMNEQQMKDRIAALEAELKTAIEAKRTLEAEVAKLTEAQNAVLAAATVSTVLKEASIPYNDNLVRRATEHPVIREGKLDQEWLKGIVKDFSAGITGQVTGMGYGTSMESQQDAETNKALESAMKRLGFKDAGLTAAMGGR